MCVWCGTRSWPGGRARYRAEGLATSYAETDRYLTELKRDSGLGFLFEVSSVPLQQALRHQHTAFVNFFAGRARCPRFKSRQALVWSWPEVDPASIEPTSVTVSREPCGRWYISLAVEVADPEPALPAGAVVGVDLGVKDFAVTSDGEKVANPCHLARREQHLARYQRRMARKQPGSNNRAKARAKVARAHRKVAASRSDFLHKTSTRLVRDHDVIVIEDLNVPGMVRNRRLATVAV